MNENEKQEFHRRINSIPYWCQTIENYQAYCRHLNYRLFQAKEELKSVYNYLEMFHGDLAFDVLDSAVNKRCIEQDDEYNATYNSKAKLEDIIGEVTLDE